MRKVKEMVGSALFMLLISVVCLLAVSALSYLYRWQAEQALGGITLSYIVIGFLGGFFQKKQSGKYEKAHTFTVRGKMMEALVLAAVYMGILLGCSALLMGELPVLSMRLWMICLLMAGSICLGRIL